MGMFWYNVASEQPRISSAFALSTKSAEMPLMPRFVTKMALDLAFLNLMQRGTLTDYCFFMAACSRLPSISE